MKPDAYEGRDPYIFVSYAHKDAEAVFEVLNELQSRGYRFWYDDGIAPGSEWPEDIAQHLNAASVVLSFITPASMQSVNCRREINFSLQREKPFISIMLEPTEMPLGIEMQLSAQQMIVRQNFDTWEKFIDKILDCREIQPCRMAVQAQDQAAGAAFAPSAQVGTASQAMVQPGGTGMREPARPAPAPAPANAAAGTARPLPETSVERATVAPSQPVPGNGAASSHLAPAPAQGQTSNAQAPQAQEKRKAPVAIIAVAVLAAVAIAVFAIGNLTTPRTFSTSWGDEIKLNSSSVYLDGETLTQEDLDNIASLEELSYLDLTSCDLSACDFNNTAFASESISSIDLSNSTGIDDYAFLGPLSPGSLYLSGCDTFDDLSVLDVSQLSTLYIDGTAVQDLQPLETATSLSELSIANTAVESLDPLAGLPNLHQLYASNSAVTGIDALANLEGIWTLDLGGCALTTPEQPLASLSLERVNLQDTGISDLSFLADCTVLEEVDLSGNVNLADLATLDPQNKVTLTMLDLAGTGLDGDDMTWVAGCANLNSLNLDGLPIENLDFCANLASLEHISAVNCGLADIEGLAGCTGLKTMQLGRNHIDSVSALANLENTDSPSIVMDLSYNDLESVDALQAGTYRALLLYGNDQAIANTLPEGVGGYEVVVAWCEGVGQSALADKEGFSTVYLVDCPQNQVLNVEDTIGKYRAELITEADLADLLRDDSFSYSLDVDNSALVATITE